MADLTFASYLQGPLGEAIQAEDGMGALPPPTFAPAVTLTPSIGQPPTVQGPPMRLLGPGDVTALAPGSVVRTDPPAGAVDVEPNYLAVAEVVPPELPWVLTPARANAAGRLRPWFVLVVVDEATTPLLPGSPLPVIEPDVGELPDLTDSWGWAHVQRTTGEGTLPGGGQASAAAVARLVCPRRLSQGVSYRACLVPAFGSGVAAGLGDPAVGELPNDLAWKVDTPGPVRLPVYHHWRFTTGPSGDFEQLVERLHPADPEALRQAAVRPVDVREPWSGEELAEGAQVVGVQGALVPFAAPPAPEPPASAEVLAAFDQRIRAHLDAPARRLASGPPSDTTGALAPPLYGGRHVSRDVVEGDPAWLAQLNTSVANRIAAGLGAEYVRANQEDLMARAWQQVGAIREANRLRAVVELTTDVAERMHERHVASLQPAEIVAVAAPASARTRTSGTTTLVMEERMSRMVDGMGTSAFARQVRPAGKLARRTGVSVQTVIPRALAGEVTVPAGAPVIPATPVVDAAGLVDVSSEAAAMQLMTMTAMVEVAALDAPGGGEAVLAERLQALALDEAVAASIHVGLVSDVATAIAEDVATVSEFTSGVLTDMAEAELGTASPFGVAIPDAAIGGRVAAALAPGDSHHARLASQTSLPGRVAEGGPSAPVMAYPDFPVPTALALLGSDPEWFMPGLGSLPMNTVALLRQNGAFIESYLVGMNHEMMRELLWREYPTDRRGTPFTRFWPRPGGGADIPAIDTWSDPAALGTRLAQAESLSVLVVRGDVIRRYPGLVVTAVRSGIPDTSGSHRPDPAQPAVPPIFAIAVDDATTAYAFEIPNAELTTPASFEAPGWFFVFAEHGYRIRFGFDEPPGPDEAFGFTTWDEARWPTTDGLTHPAFVPVARGHAVAGAAFAPQVADPEGRAWNRDAADVARIALQRPFRVAIQADVLLQP